MTDDNPFAKYAVEDANPFAKYADAPKGTGSGLVDAGNALGTGYMRGLTRLAGLGVDTIANVRDLGKAAIGAPYIALTGKAPPSWLEVGDRKNDVGSGDYLINKIGKTKAGAALINPANPEYEGGYTQLAGGALTGVIRPNTALQAVNQGVNSVLGAGAGKATYDATGSAALSAVAGMSPNAIQNGAVAGTKALVRGGEAGRVEMVQRIQDLKNAGIENPTLGLASGNSLIGGAENLLQNTPGAMGVMGRARNNALQGMNATTDAAAAASSPNRGALEAGTAIQGGVKQFRDDFKTTQSALYDRMDQFIPPLSPTSVSGTQAALARLNADIPGAPQLSKQFKNGRIQGIEAAVKADTAGNEGGTLPFQAVKQTRTLVGNEIADSGLMSDVPRSKWNALYGAISGDMQQAANQAGPQASGAFNRATDYTRAGMERMDRVAPFADKVAPEQAYTAMVQATKENVSTLQAVKKTLPEGARGSVAGTVIERLGKANSGVQNENGTVWSPETFLTNWNKMAPNARTEIFSGFKDSGQVMADVSAVAKAASMMRDNSKLWANPSGTGANLAARGLLGAITGGAAAAGAGLLNPMIPLGAGATLGAANLAARGLTSQKVVTGMASRGYMSPERLNAQAASLIGSGLLSYPKDD